MRKRQESYGKRKTNGRPAPSKEIASRHHLWEDVMQGNQAVGTGALLRS